MINEFEFINFIKRIFSSDLIGDDASVIKIKKNENLLVSKDILVEDIHFILEDNFFEIGAKSLISNISDIVAMGGIPSHFFLGIGIPDYLKERNLIKLLNGIKNISTKYNIKLAGGDTSKSEKLFISITILGLTGCKPVFRNNAKVNDDIWVTGNLGDSYVGLECILKKIEISDSLREYFIQKHYFPEIYPEFIYKLNYNGLINSMIDISDGFLQDLSHILNQSQKSAKIKVSVIPLSKQFIQIKKILGDKFLKIPLISGEEYQVIFTSPKKFRNKILEIADYYSVSVTKVGTIGEDKNYFIDFIDSDIVGFTIENFNRLGYKHF